MIVGRRATGLDKRGIRGAMVLVKRTKVSRWKKAMLIPLRKDRSQCDQDVSRFKFERKSFCRVAVGGILWDGYVR